MYVKRTYYIFRSFNRVNIFLNGRTRFARKKIIQYEPVKTNAFEDQLSYRISAILEHRLDMIGFVLVLPYSLNRNLMSESLLKSILVPILI